MFSSLLVWAFMLLPTVSSFLSSNTPQIIQSSIKNHPRTETAGLDLFGDNTDGETKSNTDLDSSSLSSQHHQRRQFLQSILSTSVSAASAATTLSSSPTPALAAEVAAVAPVEMKTFVDPKGLFALNVPKRFYAIRRTVKGDLPDEATGKGRRGSSIFTAGDLAKAEVVAVERFPTVVLLEEEGIEASGDLSTFTKIGDPKTIAYLITLRREKDKQKQSMTKLVPESVSVSEDGKTLNFRLTTSIDVQKPELLLEQTGYSELNRLTVAKATLNSNDGQIMAVFASALSQDFVGTPDGVALEEVVQSFVATDQSAGASKS